MIIGLVKLLMLEQPVGHIVKLLVVVSGGQVDQGEEEREPDQGHWHRQHPLLDWQLVEVRAAAEPASAQERERRSKAGLKRTLVVTPW